MKNNQKESVKSNNKAVVRTGVMIAGIVIFVYFLGLFMMPVYAR